jgi:hypothetical protein
MDRVGVVEYDMADHDEQPFAATGEPARKRLLACDVDEPLAHPRPELLLGGPELLFVRADDTSSFFHWSGPGAYLRLKSHMMKEIIMLKMIEVTIGK